MVKNSTRIKKVNKLLRTHPQFLVKKLKKFEINSINIWLSNIKTYQLTVSKTKYLYQEIFLNILHNHMHLISIRKWFVRYHDRILFETNNGKNQIFWLKITMCLFLRTDRFFFLKRHDWIIFRLKPSIKYTSQIIKKNFWENNL